MQRYKKGEITVFLAFTFLVLMSFIFGVMDAAMLQMTKSYRRADMNRSIESVFAEYQKELFEEYDIFGMDGSYESRKFSEDKIKDRLSYYGADGIKNELKSVELITDHGGQEFVRQAEKYTLSKYGLDFVDRLLMKEQVWKGKIEEGEKYKNEQSDFFNQYQEELSKVENPLSNIHTIKNSVMTNLVFPKEKHISDKKIILEDMVSHRKLQKGYGKAVVKRQVNNAGKPALTEYFIDHFGCAAEEQELASLDYELEYLIAGKGSDKENIEAVIRKLLEVRFVFNYSYIKTDASKKAEADVLGTAITSLLGIPETSGISGEAVLILWSFGESIMDLRSLLKGFKIPVIKTADKWQLDLQGLEKIGTSSDYMEGSNIKDGLDYEEYLKILLFMTDSKELAMRGMDLIELGLCCKKNIDWFRMDHCVTGLNIYSVCSLRKNIKYNFSTAFSYH